MSTTLATTEEIIEPTPEQLAALQEFANEHGRTWKESLRRAWHSGLSQHAANVGLLRQVRNTLGPLWLNSKANPVRSRRQSKH